MSDYITHDVLRLILKGLPVIHLLKFRCVCKSWKDLIDSRSFILDNLAVQSIVLFTQNTRSKNRKLEYLVFDPDDLYLLGTLVAPGLDAVETAEVSDSIKTADEEKFHHPLTAVSTLHGVICLYDNENRLFLWNPSIRRLLKLPVPQVRSDPTDLVPERYDDDEDYDDDFKCCGFWIDPSNDDFKIVIFFFLQRKYAVFSSRIQTWIQVDIDSVRLTEVAWSWTKDPQILIDGVGYWRLYDEYPFYKGVIVYFDFGQDKLGTIDLPMLEEQDEVDYNIRVIKWLHCVAFVYWQEESPCGCDLWVMHSGSWSKMFRFNLFENVEYPLYVVEDKLVLAQSKSGKLVVYDPEDGWSLLDPESFSSGWYVLCYDFVESLVFPNLELHF